MRAPEVSSAAPVGRGPAAGGLAGRFGEVLAALDARSAGRTPLDTADPAALLAAQAALYREAERIELASRVVDQGVGAVKTLLQTRV